MSNVFFISDLHLGHKNILKFGQRDQNTIEEHDDAIVESWNSVVKKRDLVWVLGDVAMELESLKLFDKMLGSKRLIMGNHDRFPMAEYMKYFTDIRAFEKRYHGLAMTHIPIHPNEMKYRNWVTNVHGHIHDPTKGFDDPRYFNVNVDIIGMVPMDLKELQRRIQLKGMGYDLISI